MSRMNRFLHRLGTDVSTSSTDDYMDTRETGPATSSSGAGADGTGAAGGGGSGSTRSVDDDRMRKMMWRMRHRMIRGFLPDDLDDLDDMDGLTPEERREMMRFIRRDPHMMMDFDPWDDPFRRHYHRQTTEPPLNKTELMQRSWELPVLRNPDQTEEVEMEAVTMDVAAQNQGVLQTDAALYTITEEMEDKKTKHHCMLKMPSEIPPQLTGGQRVATNPDTHYNILMADASGSMGSYWHKLMEGWNTYVAPQLKGRTNIYAFSGAVNFIRTGTHIEAGDIDHSLTDLTSALMKMTEEVYKCKEKYVKVFLVTDGEHNATKVEPRDILSKLQAPSTKTVDVFVLGAGDGFPVTYSITLRSLLHNGSSNLPSLFWAKGKDSMVEQLKHIASCISSGVSRTLTLSKSGFSLPGTSPNSEFHLSEWVYFPTGPEQVQNLTLTKGACFGQLILCPRLTTPPVLNEIFRQWNTILIQMHTKKQQLPFDALPFMQRLFKAATEQRGPKTTIRERLARKEEATNQLEFETLMNKVKAVLTTERFSNELELADNILSTTVGGGKYETKVLQLKGHTDQDFQNDTKEFLKVVERHRDAITSITVTHEDCCRITMTSTLSDIQDEDLPELMKMSKFEFLKEFTISGIGVCAPMRDSVTINPWSFGVKSILGHPYTIVSQKAMETFAATNSVSGHDKEVQLKADDESTRFNAVVPVFPPEAAKVIGPLIQTRLYAMCTTFAILKNPHMVDFNIHFAALGVVWVRLLHEYPTAPRPEHVQHRIHSIETTAELYIQRTGLTTFWRLLKEQTPQALMTESTEMMEGRTIKCESLIKAMFILHLYLLREKLDTATLTHIIKMLLLEYIGRCLSHYKTGQNDAKPFTDFFAEELSDQNRQQQWANRQLAILQEQIGSEVHYELKDFYRFELVKKAARKEINQRMRQVQQQFTEGITITLSKARVERLRNVTSAGDVSWPTLRTFVNETGLPQDTVEELFSEQSLAIYTTHALEYRNSRERLTSDMPDYKTAISKAKTAVHKENSKLIGDDIKQKLVELLTNGWLKAYNEAHCAVVQPMTQAQIVAEACERGIEVTEASFDQVYRRYRPNVGLLGNACQSRDCPFFLIPDRRYNQHTIVERLTHAAFPHTFHRTAYQYSSDSVSTVSSKIASGFQSRSNKTVPQEILQPLTDSLASLIKWYSQQGN